MDMRYNKEGYVSPEDNRSIFRSKYTSGSELDRVRQKNNPKRKPVGAFTGRCAHCGSDNLWDDNLAYGCNDCGAMLGGNG